MLRNIRIYNDYGEFVNIIFTSICLFDNMKLPTDLLCLLTVFNQSGKINPILNQKSRLHYYSSCLEKGTESLTYRSS